MSENLTDSHLVLSASARWYPITILVTLLLLLSIIPCAMLRLADHGPTDHTSANAQFIYFFGNQKQNIAKQTQDRRLFLLGGSSAFYSVRAKMLEAQFGIPVINNALHAGLGINYLLYRARQSLRRGDTAILFIEYDLYRSEPSWTLADYLLPFNVKYFATQPLTTQIGLIGKLTPSEYWNRVYDAVFGKLIDGKKILSNMNGYGDIKDNLLELKKEPQKAKLDAVLPDKNLVLPRKDADAITDFIRWCQHNQITVIAGYPAFLDFPEYHSGTAQEFFHALEKYYHSLGVPTLGEPSDFMFPKSMFFDTEYHLHDGGAAVMTALVAQRLEPILGIPRRTMLNTKIDHPFGLIFSEDNVPDEVSLTGFSGAEPWGRWTVAEKAGIKFDSTLPAFFRLDARVMRVFGENAKTPILVRVGKEERSVLVSAPNTRISLEFHTDGKTNTIEIIPPKPQSPKQLGLGNDDRLLGLGFSQLKIIPMTTGTTQIDHPLRLMLSEENVSDEVSLTGFSDAEPWGRWTVAEKAGIKFDSTLPAFFRLDARVMRVFGENAKTPILVRVGKEERSVLVSAPNTRISLEFHTDGKTNAIEIIPPKPQSPKQLGLNNDGRLLGLGFSWLEIVPLTIASNDKSIAKYK